MKHSTFNVKRDKDTNDANMKERQIEIDRD